MTPPMTPPRRDEQIFVPPKDIGDTDIMPRLNMPRFQGLRDLPQNFDIPVPRLPTGMETLVSPDIFMNRRNTERQNFVAGGAPAKILNAISRAGKGVKKKLSEADRKFEEARERSGIFPGTSDPVNNPFTYLDAKIMGGLLTPPVVLAGLNEKRKRDDLSLANSYGQRAAAEGKTLDEAIRQYTEDAKVQGLPTVQYYLMEIENGYNQAMQNTSR